MSAPGDERLDAISHALAGVHRRLDQFEARLVKLESARGLSAAEAPEKPAQEQAVPVERPAPPPPTAAPAPAERSAAVVREGAIEVAHASAPSAPRMFTEPPADEPSQTESGPGPEMETRVGLTWVNRIGALTLVLGVAFFFKYAVDNQWIGEGGRVALGVLAGFAALGLAEFAWRRSHRIYAQGITGAGIAILYLSFYAGFGFYHLLPQSVAFLLMMLTTATAGALAIRYAALPIAVLALIGGYMTPILLSTKEDRPWAFFGYLLVLNVGAMALARTQKWRVLESLALSGTALLSAMWGSDRFAPEKRGVATFYCFAYYALFVAADTPLLAGAAQILAGLAIVLVWWDVAANSLWLALPLAAAGLIVAARRAWRGFSLVAFLTFWIGCVLWQTGNHREMDLGTRLGSLSALGGDLGAVLGALTAGFLLFLGWLVWRYVFGTSATQEQELAVLGLNGAVYFGLCYQWLEPHYHGYLGLFAVVLGALHLGLGLRMWTRRQEAGVDLRAVLLSLGVALGFLTLAIPIQFTGHSITMAWAVEAAVLVWIGMRANAPRFLWIAGAVYILACCRLLALDAVMYSGGEAHSLVFNSRLLTFLVTTACLWAGAYWLPRATMALVPYLAGHVALWIALVLEVSDWAWRSMPPAEAESVNSLAVSILFGVYGVVLVSVGVATRTVVNRVLGLGLLGFVVLKLYFYDVWQLERVYRIVAFSLLGVLLLATSFLYSRYRSRIERLWHKHEDLLA